MKLDGFEINEEDIEKVEVETIGYKCDNCGDEMLFDPDSNCLKCDSCGNKIEFEQKEQNVRENDFLSALENENTINIDEGTKVNEIECESCGAILVYENNVFANKCVYCGSSHVQKNETSSYLKPEYLVPFAISKKYSNDLVDKWCKGKFFMDKNFKENVTANDLYGVYIPYWTYDTSTLTHYTAMRGKHYFVTRTRRVNGKTETYQEMRTRWYPVSGMHNKFFDDILVPATFNTENINYKQIIHFNLEALVEYDEKYVTGFLAKKYDLKLKEGWENAKINAQQELKYEIERRIGGDVVAGLKMDTNYSNITFKHILLPLWIYTYNHKGKIYNFLINGQTGTIFAKYPLNWLRVILTSISVVIVCLILYNFIGIYINS